MSGAAAPRRLVLAQLRALERWVAQAHAVHPRPQVLEAPFERDALQVCAAARGDRMLQQRVGMRVARLRARLQLCPPAGDCRGQQE